MKTILLAGAAAIFLAATPAWVSRPALPGDQFQLAAGDTFMVQKQAPQDDGMIAQMQRAAGESIMAPVAKGEGWM